MRKNIRDCRRLLVIALRVFEVTVWIGIRPMINGTVKFVLGDSEQEDTCIQTIVTQAIQTKTTLFLGRFLSDMSLSDAVRSLWNDSNLVLRQYGHSYHVNTYPPLADARRIEIGFEEAEVALRSGKYDVVLLSQILDAVDEDLLTTPDIASLLEIRPKHVTLIVTGCNASTEIVAQCKTINTSIIE